jgi:hypothetical protein
VPSADTDHTVVIDLSGWLVVRKDLDRHHR